MKINRIEQSGRMDCGCEGITKNLKLEGDAGTDPIWCNQCGFNLNLEEVPLSHELITELDLWMRGYGKWIDWKTDQLIPND